MLWREGNGGQRAHPDTYEIKAPVSKLIKQCPMLLTNYRPCNQEVLTKIEIIGFIFNERNLPYLVILVTRRGLQNKDKNRCMRNKEELTGSLMRSMGVRGQFSSPMPT